ncbi:MAG: heparan-alpha-glucosaminide N-acetyltransferase domain-containing protein [Planctomycetota bacterium]
MTAAPPAAPPPRLASIDLLRGLVMVVMLLDHARDFVHRDGLTGDPTAPGSGAALFFTRWITHFCAPSFVLLAGVAARLQQQRGLPPRDLAGYLWRRGLFLVLLEVVVLRPLIWFQFDYAFLAHLQVIWAIGWSMCGLALLLRLGVRPTAIALLGVALVAAHNLLPHVRVDFAGWSSWQALVILLLRRGAIQFGADGPVAFVQYPLLPWFGVLLCGYALGALFALPADARRRWLWRAGLGATALFVLLRGLAHYGDPDRWAAEPGFATNVFAFLRTEKYPPSLQFVLMTVGPALMALAAFDGVRRDGALRHLVAVGRVPLFFYVLQWPAVHLVSRLFQWLAGQPVGWDSPNPLVLTELPPGCGFSLPVVYAAWTICLAALVPLSVGFARWKAANGHRRWLHYV